MLSYIILTQVSSACCLTLGARLSFYFRMIFRIILNCISYNQLRNPDQGSQRNWSKYRRYLSDHR